MDSFDDLWLEPIHDISLPARKKFLARDAKFIASLRWAPVVSQFTARWARVAGYSLRNSLVSNYRFFEEGDAWLEEFDALYDSAEGLEEMIAEERGRMVRFSVLQWCVSQWVTSATLVAELNLARCEWDFKECQRLLKHSRTVRVVSFEMGIFDDEEAAGILEDLESVLWKKKNGIS